MSDFILEPSDNPGAYERHLLRRHKNPLFKNRQTQLDQPSQLKAQEKDHERLMAFQKKLHDLFNQAVSLKPNEESDVILKIKSELDELYETACNVADDQTENKTAIRSLIDSIMKTVIASAGNDSQAQQELQQETIARDTHFELLECKLVGDLISPNSPIKKADLVPTLLSASKDDLALCLQIFDPKQLTLVIQEGEALLNSLGKNKVNISNAAENIVFIQGFISYMNNYQDSPPTA